MRILNLLLALIIAQGPTIPMGNTGTPLPSNHFAFVQICGTNQTVNTTSFAVNIGASGAGCTAAGAPQNPVAGHLLVIYLAFHGTVISTPSCSDTLGNSWTTSYNDANLEAYSWSVLTTGGADTVTCTTGAIQTGGMISLELSGNNVSPADGSGVYGSLSSSTTWTLSGITTANSNDVIIGCAFSRLNVTGGFTAGSGYIIPFGQYMNSSNNAGVCEYQFVTLTGTYAPTVTLGTAQAGSGLTLAFKSS